jgi:hypothetical protein
MKRPFAFPLLALTFGWLAMAAFALAWVAPHTEVERLNTLNLDVGMLVAIGVFYGSSATAVMVGLWRVASWAARAVLVWGASLLSGMIVLQAMIGIRGEPWWLVPLPHLVFGAFIAATFRYVNRQSKIVPQAI